MSANHGPDYPDELKLSIWDKKKGSLPSGHDVGAKLKALQKKHEAVDWKLFDTGWSKAAKTTEELDEAFALRDRLYRGSVFALKKDALAVAGAAKAMEKEKGAAKPVVDAAKAITKAANGYADDIDKGVDDLKASCDGARGGLPSKAAAKGDDDGEDDEPGSVLLDPKRLVAQLKQCQRTPERTVQFAFVDAAGKDQPAVLAMHPKMSSTSLFNKVKKETGGKTGAYGSAWVDGTSLMLQLDKPLGGLVKKVRAAVKAAGFRVAKVVLWQADGTVFEQDDEPDADPAVDTTQADAARSTPPAPPGPSAKAAAAAPAAPSAQAAAFAARLKALLESVAKTGDAPLIQQAKLLGSEAGTFARKGEWERVAALMEQAEALRVPAPAATAKPQAGAGDGPAADAADAQDAAWQQRFEATEKVYLEVMARQPADASKLRAVMDFANGKAEARQYAAAAQALDRLDGMLARLMAVLPETPEPLRGATGTARARQAAQDGAAELPDDFPERWQKASEGWRAASETVDEQIRRLQARLRNEDDHELQRIAELGLNAVTGNHKVPLMVAIREIDGARSGVTAAAVAEARVAVSEFLAHLQTDARVAACDDNPFDVKVSVRSTLGPALQQLAAALAR